MGVRAVQLHPTPIPDHRCPRGGIPRRGPGVPGRTLVGKKVARIPTSHPWRGWDVGSAEGAGRRPGSLSAGSLPPPVLGESLARGQAKGRRQGAGLVGGADDTNFAVEGAPWGRWSGGHRKPEGRGWRDGQGPPEGGRQPGEAHPGSKEGAREVQTLMGGGMGTGWGVGLPESCGGPRAGVFGGSRGCRPAPGATRRGEGGEGGADRSRRGCRSRRWRRCWRWTGRGCRAGPSATSSSRRSSSRTSPRG